MKVTVILSHYFYKANTKGSVVVVIELYHQLRSYFNVVGPVEDSRPVLGLIDATKLHAMIVTVASGKRPIQRVAVERVVRYRCCETIWLSGC